MTAFALLATIAAEISPERLQKVCGDDPANECRWVLDWTDNQFLAHVSDRVVAPIVQIIIIWIVAVAVNRLVRLLIKRIGHRLEGAAASGRYARMKARTPRMLMETGSVSIRAAARAKTTTAVLRSISTFVVYAVAVLYTFSALGLRLGPLIAGAGIAGVALGFGAQSMVKDFLGGMFMLIEDQFGVGDVIDVSSVVDGTPGVAGTVEEVTLRITSVRDVNGTIWHIPNGEIRRIGNMSQGWARALLDVPVPYGTDLELAQSIITLVAHDVTHAPPHRSEVLGEPEVWGVEDLGPDAVVIRLVIKTRPGEQWPIARALRAELHNAFIAAGIERPFAQHDVYLHDEDAADRPRAVGGSRRDVDAGDTGSVDDAETDDDTGSRITSLDDLQN
ncbi:MAG TPA: mechanosensitive ion channel family protein [Acidimicrobiales bacterium]|nr:mechanosensitive ion channel family protein [Acidimicrobiales bacterium]